MIKLLITACLVFWANFCIAQVKIIGPSCVEGNFPYSYELNGIWTTESTMQLCVTGGLIIDSNTYCISGSPVNSIKIKWLNENNDQGNIELTSSIGNANLKVIISPALNPGEILSQSKIQTIKPDSAVAIIECTPARGGGCQSNFIYQWQSSVDAVNWLNIEGTNTTNFEIRTPIKETTFFRRKNVQPHSNTISFSEMAVVYVEINPN